SSAFRGRSSFLRRARSWAHPLNRRTATSERRWPLTPPEHSGPSIPRERRVVLAWFRRTDRRICSRSRRFHPCRAKAGKLRYRSPPAAAKADVVEVVKAAEGALTRKEIIRALRDAGKEHGSSTNREG